VLIPEGQLRIWLYVPPTDLRKSFDGLSALVRTKLAEDPLSGQLFVFLNRRRTQLKILYFDRSGYCVWAKRLEQGRDMAAKAKATATVLARKVKEGAVCAADALVEANRDPSALTVRFLNANLTVLSPSEEISVTRPDAATLVIADSQGNGLVVNVAADMDSDS